MRYGSVHSSGKNIIPIGDSVAFRFMLDDYQKGKFWSRTIAEHDEAAKAMYPDKRTYLQQLQEAVKGNAQEIFICIDTPGNDFSGLHGFTKEIIKQAYKIGYEKELIFSPPNECLEHMSVTEYIMCAMVIEDEIKNENGMYLSIGGMASEFTDFYRRIATEIPYYDYIDFHTSNDGNTWSIAWLAQNMPSDKLLINSEHYLLNCAKTYGYNSDICLNRMKEVTDYMLSWSRIKSIYVTVPSIYKENPDDRQTVLRYVDINNNVIMTTKMWYLLKLYEEGKEVMANLKELKKTDTGYQVIALQNLLKESYEPKLKVDGAFGDATEKAVNKYRKSIGFKETGYCSYNMWYMLLQGEKSRPLVLDLFELLKVI
jgi:hypothetical protein